MDLDTILDNCLQRMEAGESVASCLARHPDHASVLAPMLAAASQLNVLREERLTETERVHARAVLRAALAARQNEARWPRWGALFRDGRVATLVGIACALLFVAVTITAVADSQPGKLPYRLRIVAERAAVLMQPSPDDRASAALDFAERRLTDVSDGFVADGRADSTALDAFLRGVEGAVHTANSLTPEEKLAIARRVKAQAEQLHQLAQSAADSPAAPSFQAAADRAYAVVNRLGLEANDTPSSAPSPQPMLRAGEGQVQDTVQAPQAASDTTSTPQLQKTPAIGAPTSTSSSRPSRMPGPALSVLTVTPTSSPTRPPLPATGLASQGKPTAAAGTGAERSTIPRRPPTTVATQTAPPTISAPAVTPRATVDDAATVPSPTPRPPTTDTVVPNTKPAVVTTLTPASEPFPATPIAGPSRKPPARAPAVTPVPSATTPESPALPRPTPDTPAIGDTYAPNSATTSAANPGGSTIDAGQPVPAPTPF